MTEQANKQETNFAAYSPRKAPKLWIKVFLGVSAVLLAAGLAVTASLLMGTTSVAQDRIERVVEYNTVARGVSVAGVDISGMTEAQAREATAHIEPDLLGAAVFEVDVDGQIVNYDAQSFGMYTDYEQMLSEALQYGHFGTFEERKAAAETAMAQGVDYPVDVYIDEALVDEVMLALKAVMDTEPAEAGYTFMPWGYLPDGTPYEPDVEKMIEDHARVRSYEMPENLVRIADEDMPNPLRYQFYRYDRYIEDYIPDDANISRFLYASEAQGLILDAQKTGQMILDAVANDDYSPIVAPVEITETDAKIDDMLYNTQLIASWTSSYYTHRGYERNYNVGRLSSIVCSVVIQPGETWSINEEAGPRVAGRGWKMAAGIDNGAFTPQYGGGVCQMSSTTYNAALRAGLEIVDSRRHSIVSDYIPIGLDATISTGSPDLKLKNPYDVPIYLVSYVNGEDYNVTVEIYGPPVVDDTYGAIILDYSSVELSRKGTGTTTVIYNTPVAPDGTEIGEGESYEMSQTRSGRQAQTYIHYLALDGTELKKEKFYYHWYKPINGRTYVNGPETPDPTPGPDPTPTPPAATPTPPASTPTPPTP